MNDGWITVVTISRAYYYNYYYNYNYDYNYNYACLVSAKEDTIAIWLRAF